MIGATAKSEQFYERSGSEATKGSRSGANLLGWGESPLAFLTDKERDAAIKASLLADQTHLQIEATALAAILSQSARPGFRPNEGFYVAAARKQAIKGELTSIAAQLSQLKAKHSPPVDSTKLPDFFLDVSREYLTKAQFQLVMNEAHRRLRAQEGES